jgi:hypothetical protein
MIIKYLSYTILLSFFINSIPSIITNKTDEIIVTCTSSSISECPFSDPEYDPIKDSLKIKSNKDNSMKCTECEAVDPVFDPGYNMKEICKQSILLEEHLIHRSKRCRDCITKHFLHIIGLAEEAAALCTISIKNYPLLLESIELYRRTFDDWLEVYKTKGIESESDFCEISGRLRKQRKLLIDIYFYKENYGAKMIS